MAINRFRKSENLRWGKMEVFEGVLLFRVFSFDIGTLMR